MKDKKKVLSKKRIRGGRTIYKRRKRMKTKKHIGGKRGRPQLLPNVTTVADTYNTVDDIQDIATYNPQDTLDIDEQAEIAAEDVADQLDSENKDHLDSFDSIDESHGLIGDNDDYGLHSMKKYDKEQREELESKMGTPALVDMRKMKKEHFPGLGIMSTIAQAMGASKKKKKKKKRKRTEKKEKEKKGKGKKGKRKKGKGM